MAKSKVKFAAGVYFRPTFSGKKKLKLAAKVNNMKQGQIVRDLIDKGIGDDGKIAL